MPSCSAYSFIGLIKESTKAWGGFLLLLACKLNEAFEGDSEGPGPLRDVWKGGVSGEPTY